MATVSGVRNDTKIATDIGNDLHRLVQEAFCEGHLSDNYQLIIEAEVDNPLGGMLRADLVAIKDEREDDGVGDLWIYVGEIKSESDEYYAPGKAYRQLDTYLNAYKRKYPHAYVGKLTSWNSDVDGYPLVGNGYDCTVFIANASDGLYRYSGRSTVDGESKKSKRIEKEGFHKLPFNEQPNYQVGS
ncbi:hypothetical protein [Amycolatopsis sp. NPDC051071]|uniref:hypothetical protein n=1 Tax=Amycolatopsis sp. NPDC051071 TaxID=3154637 RepID=UPI00341322D3